jgi:hypothetical protein
MNTIRSIVTHTLLGLGVPIWLFTAVLGYWLIASALWLVGVYIIWRVEHAAGDMLRAHLASTGQVIPEWLDKPYLFTKYHRFHA